MEQSDAWGSEDLARRASLSMQRSDPNQKKVLQTVRPSLRRYVPRPARLARAATLPGGHGEEHHLRQLSLEDRQSTDTLTLSVRDVHLAFPGRSKSSVGRPLLIVIYGQQKYVTGQAICAGCSLFTLSASIS